MYTYMSGVSSIEKVIDDSFKIEGDATKLSLSGAKQSGAPDSETHEEIREKH